MRAVVVILLALTGVASASEKAHFWGTWEPRPILREFWRPVGEKWWSCNKRGECGPDFRLRKRCKEFARSHSPETALPEMIGDLLDFGSEANGLVYLCIMGHWPRSRVVRVLDALSRSVDPGVRATTELMREDFLDVHE